MNAEKLVRETLRMKLRAGGKPGEYALYVSPSGVKVALASDYNLAMLAGMKDFWQCVPECETAPEPLPPFDDETDPHHCKRCFTCIFDGHGKTYVSGGTHTVPESYTCTMATPEEIRDVIDHAKRKADYIIFPALFRRVEALENGVGHPKRHTTPSKRAKRRSKTLAAIQTENEPLLAKTAPRAVFERLTTRNEK